MKTERYFTAEEISYFSPPSLPDSRRRISDFAERNAWPSRPRNKVGGGVEYPLSALPLEARIHITMALAKQASKEHKRSDMSDEDREILWDRWDKATPKAKSKASLLNAACIAVDDLMINEKITKSESVDIVASNLSISSRTLWNALKRVEGFHREDWTAALIPKSGGGKSKKDIPADIWEMLKADWLRPEQPNFSDCYRRAQKMADEKGVSLPSEKTVMRRLMALPVEIRTLCRKGEKYLKAMYPAQQRDKRALHAMEAVNSDGHKIDVFVKWPDANGNYSEHSEVGRPVLVGFQDIYSGKMLSWRVDKSENTEAVRLAFGDMIEAYGIPEHVVLDNGRNFASKWLTGGIPNRFRFKVKEEEPQGILPALGCKIHWAMPYSGQSKPIERYWRDIAQGIARCPEFSGAYVGNNPIAKPENYGSHAVPLEEFLQVLDAGIKELNAREGRRSAVCNGRSLDQAFAESYAKASIQKATDKQRRLWLLAAECVKPSRTDGSLSLAGNRYWAEFLTMQIGKKLTVRFDPQKLQADLHVYTQEGIYLGAAPCHDASGFMDQQQAQEHSRNRTRFMKAQKEQLKALVKMKPQDVAEQMAKLRNEAEESLIETRVVRPVFGKSSEHQSVFEGDLYERGENEEEIRADEEQRARLLRFERKQA